MSLACKCLIVLATSICVVSGWGESSPAQDDAAVLQRILKDWQQRQEACQRVKYTFQYHEWVPKGQWSDLVRERSSRLGEDAVGADWIEPSEDTYYHGQLAIWLDFESNRVRREFEGERFHVDRRTKIRECEISLFDGSQYQVFRPRHRQSHDADDKYYIELQIRKHTLDFFNNHPVHPMFVAHGILPTKEREFVPIKDRPLRVALDPKQYRVHARTRHEGRPVVVLRSKNLSDREERFYEFWVDPARGSAIVRDVFYIDGQEWSHTDISYVQIAETWLPDGWTFTIFDGKRVTGLRQVDNVDVEINSSFDEVEFRVEPTAGMFVADHTNKRTYRKGGPGEADMDAEAFIRMDRAKGFSRMNPHLLWWLVALAPLLVIGGFWVFRRLRHKSCST
jgi:hypothetical protein